MNKLTFLVAILAASFSSFVNATEASFFLNDQMISTSLRLDEAAGTSTYQVIIDATVEENSGEKSGMICSGAAVGNSTFRPDSFTLSAGLMVCGAKDNASQTSAAGFPLYLAMDVPLLLNTQNRFFKYLVVDADLKYAPSMLSFGNDVDGIVKWSVGVSINPFKNVKFGIRYEDAQILFDSEREDLTVFSGVIGGAEVRF